MRALLLEAQNCGRNFIVCVELYINLTIKKGETLIENRHTKSPRVLCVLSLH